MEEAERRALYRSVFVLSTDGARVLEDLQEGILGDCGCGPVLEPLAGLAFANRYSVVQLIKELIDGRIGDEHE